MSAAAGGELPPNRQEPLPGDQPAGASYASNEVSARSLGDRRGKIRVFPHIDDLVAARPDVNVLASIRRLLEKGESCAKQADTQLDFLRPDIALQEYIMASTIVVNLIPRHKDYPELKSDRGDLHRLYAGLQKRITARHQKFEEIKQLIKEDNARSGVEPTMRRRLSTDLAFSAMHNEELESETLAGPEKSRQEDSLGSLGVHLDDGEPGKRDTIGSRTSLHDESYPPQRKPLVQPKPDALHGHAIKSDLRVGEKDLEARFSRLRGATPHSSIQDPRIRTQLIGMSDTVDIVTRRDSAPFSSTVANNTRLQHDRPLGPRDMPKAPTAPPNLQKPLLVEETPYMPKPPEAVYSPARNLGNPTNLEMLRSGSRHALGAPGKPASVTRTSRALRSKTAISEESDRTANPPSLTKKLASRKSLDYHLPEADTVTAEELVDYLKQGSHILSILVVDIRDREDFNDGHILSHSVICMEPIVLRHGISAEEIRQSLVLSPEAEQDLFDMRDTFDLVVYHDQLSTSSESKISGNRRGDLTLGDFAKAVYDYGYEKRLKRPPRLLVGGLNAWIDLMGSQALETAQGLHPTSKEEPNRPARPFASTPENRQANAIMARGVTRAVRNLSNEEENRWKTTLREKVAAISLDEISYVRTTEDFFRRFPELASTQESMVYPSQLSNSQPADSPTAANADAALSRQDKSFTVPKVPARPAPALPRQSYSGVSKKDKYSSTALVSASPFEFKGTSTISGNQNKHAGLRNIGNTCYMNAVLQALKATQPLYDAIMLLNTDSTPLPVKTGETQAPGQIMIGLLQVLYRSLCTGKTQDAADVQKYASQKYPGGVTGYFGDGKQHDASEFLLFVLDELQMEFNYSRIRGPLMPLTSSQEAVRRELPDMTSSWMEWQRFIHGNTSIVSHTLFSQVLSSYTCIHCGKIGKSWGRESHLIVPVIAGRSMNLVDAMDRIFSQPTFIADSTCYACKEVGHQRSDRLARFPENLIVLLNRYAFAENEGSKTTTRVTFPLNDLSLDRYFITKEGLSPAQMGATFLPPATYNCYAIINHLGGTLDTGHYTAFVKETNQKTKIDGWWYYDDANVQAVPRFKTVVREAAQASAAFVLFYKRQPQS